MPSIPVSEEIHVMSAKVKCSVCGKEVSEMTMAKHIDLRVCYSGDGDLPISAGPHVGHEYFICYECYLRSLGVRAPSIPLIIDHEQEVKLLLEEQEAKRKL
jgi:hypothetical protein